MKRSTAYWMLIVFSLLVLTGCSCKHQWTDANCVSPKTCSLCETTEGEPIGHSWADASCTEPKTCAFCGETEGDALGHEWDVATCESPKTCTACTITEGEAAGHSWSDWTRVETDACRICEICGSEHVITMSDYLIAQLQGYWISTLDPTNSDVPPNWFTTLEIRADGTAGVYTPFGVYPSCTLEYVLPNYDLNRPFDQEQHSFTLTANNAEASFRFDHIPQEDFLSGYQLFIYEREPAETAIVRELLQGKWDFDSFYAYDPALADLDHSGYTVEFHEGNQFTVHAETQLEGTWVYYPDNKSEANGITYHSIIAAVGEDIHSMYFTLEIHNDSGAMVLRIERPSVERTGFVKAQ